MDKNSITPSVALEGLNNIESMISRWCIVLECLNKEDESYNECVEEMKKDAYICVKGLKEIADYIVNERQMGLALKLESIAKKNVELLQMVKAKAKGEDFLEISQTLFCINANSRFAKNGIAIQETFETTNNYPTIPKEVRDLFPSDEQCETFVRMNYGKSHKIVANAYLEEKGVVHPDSPKYVAVRTTLYNYFILPFKPKDGEKRNNIYCDPSTFYKHFKY